MLFHAYIDDGADRNRERVIIAGAIVCRYAWAKEPRSGNQDWDIPGDPSSAAADFRMTILNITFITEENIACVSDFILPRCA